MASDSYTTAIKNTQAVVSYSNMGTAQRALEYAQLAGDTFDGLDGDAVIAKLIRLNRLPISVPMGAGIRYSAFRKEFMTAEDVLKATLDGIELGAVSEVTASEALTTIPNIEPTAQ
jgi:hypothetical protein